MKGRFKGFQLRSLFLRILPFAFFLLLSPPAVFSDSENVTHVSKLIQNFAEPKPGVYRGAQPNEEGVQALKALGVKTDISFRFEPDLVEQEKKICEKLGIRYVAIPWDGRTQPKRQEVDQFIDLLKNEENYPVFFHCKRGAERTGIMWACYRVAVDHWDPDRAFQEMKQYQFRSYWYPHLRRFLYDFSGDYGFKKEYTSNPLTKIKEWFLSAFVYPSVLYREKR